MSTPAFDRSLRCARAVTALLAPLPHVDRYAAITAVTTAHLVTIEDPTLRRQLARAHVQAVVEALRDGALLDQPERRA